MSNEHVKQTCCNFEPRDLVDWCDPVRSVQARWWHGIIKSDEGVGPLGKTESGHKFLVEWTLGSSWERFQNLDGDWVSPEKNSHFQVQLCSELRKCEGEGPNHPPGLS